MKKYTLELKELVKIVENNPYKIWYNHALMEAVNNKLPKSKRFIRIKSFSNSLLRTPNFPYYLFKNTSKNTTKFIFIKK